MLFIVVMLALDLGVFHRESHEIRLKEALTWCAVWFSLAMTFNAIVWWWLGAEPAKLWLAGYLVEIALSVDNVFVFIVIFSFFRVPKVHQHRVLVWGIIGAAIMRFVFILAGISLMERFHWLIYVFGVFLVFTGIKLALPHQDELNPEKNWAVRLFRRFYPVTPEYHGKRFFIVIDGVKKATPLFVVLLVVETTDVAFALDSIPAVLAITNNPFIVFTSNIFAILGLRALYFALSGVMGLFRYLNIGLAMILVFIGVKMLASNYIHVPIEISLGIIATVLVISVAASLLIPQRQPDEPPPSA